MTAYTPADLAARKYGATIYLQMPGQRLPWRFTKVTETGWKRVDGLARPNQWVSNEQLADLANEGTITNPFTKENKS